MNAPDDPGTREIVPADWFSLGPFVLGSSLGFISGVFLFWQLIGEIMNACHPLTER